jgi:metal-responsive CopG/Arc/MetJ family transcriptional regulator
MLHYGTHRNIYIVGVAKYTMKEKRMSIDFPSEVAKALQKYSDEELISRPDVIRKALVDYLVKKGLLEKGKRYL